MILAILVAILAFSNIADEATGKFSGAYAKCRKSLASSICGKPQSEEPLRRKLMRLRGVTLMEVFLQFMFLNLLGMFVSRYAASYTPVGVDDWSWCVFRSFVIAF